MAVFEDGDVGGVHLLRAVVGDAQAIVPDAEAAHLDRLARTQQHLLALPVAGPGEAEHHEDDAEMDDVAAVAPARPHYQTDHGGDHVAAGHAAADDSAPDELLPDRAGHESAERKADAGNPHPEAERDEHRGDDERERHRPEELLAQVRQRRLPPGEKRPDAGQQQQRQPDRDHPLVEEGRSHRDPLACHRLAERREHRREQDEEGREQEDPVVHEERRLARRPRLEVVTRPEQRQAVDDQAEGDQHHRADEERKHHRELGVLAERMDRLHDAGPRQRGCEQGQREGEDDE